MPSRKPAWWVLSESEAMRSPIRGVVAVSSASLSENAAARLLTGLEEA